MFNEIQAKMLVEKEHPGSKAEVCVKYKDLYLVRIKHADPDEQNYDPFFSVDPNTGEVRDFSVITDGNILEISDLFTRAGNS